MKKKDLKKISKFLFNELEGYKEQNYDKKSVPSPYADDYQWCDYDEDVSIKFKKLVHNLLKYPDNLRIELGETWINLHTDNIKLLKNSSSMGTSNRNKLSSEEDYLKVEILKESGFSINYGYRKTTRYKDKFVFSELIDIIKERVKEINSDNFNDIWEKISKESGILRDSNLDDILAD